MYRKPNPRCRSELIDSAWVVIVPDKNAFIINLKNIYMFSLFLYFYVPVCACMRVCVYGCVPVCMFVRACMYMCVGMGNYRSYANIQGCLVQIILHSPKYIYFLTFWWRPVIPPTCSIYISSHPKIFVCQFA